MKIINIIERYRRGLLLYALGGFAFALSVIFIVMLSIPLLIVQDYFSFDFNGIYDHWLLIGAILAPYLLGGTNLRKAALEIYFENESPDYQSH